MCRGSSELMPILWLVATVLAVGTGAGSQGLREVQVETSFGTVHALCTPGPVRVVMMHGNEDRAEDWRGVLVRLDGRVGACAWDRRGFGRSLPAPEARGWYELLEELRAVHAALGVEGPVVVVGQGLGGVYARLLAAERSISVDGVVLLDPDHRDYLARAAPGMPESARVREEARQRTPNRDGIVEIDVLRRAEDTRPREIPVTVVTATEREDGEGWDARFINHAASDLHADIAGRTRLGRQVPAMHSGPRVHVEEPELVAGEIDRVLRSAVATRRRR